ncbi:hypothetical protein BJ742DRAFT_807080 [Cladochytrium replicatum]|nr:hypothetical protein BJ742DRAFT_807080 [Cladochytrium replicatum]
MSTSPTLVVPTSAATSAPAVTTTTTTTTATTTLTTTLTTTTTTTTTRTTTSPFVIPSAPPVEVVSPSPSPSPAAAPNIASQAGTGIDDYAASGGYFDRYGLWVGIGTIAIFLIVMFIASIITWSNGRKRYGEDRRAKGWKKVHQPERRTPAPLPGSLQRPPPHDLSLGRKSVTSPQHEIPAFEGDSYTLEAGTFNPRSTPQPAMTAYPPGPQQPYSVYQTGPPIPVVPAEQPFHQVMYTIHQPVPPARTVTSPPASTPATAADSQNVPSQPRPRDTLIVPFVDARPMSSASLGAAADLMTAELAEQGVPDDDEATSAIGARSSVLVANKATTEGQLPVENDSMSDILSDVSAATNVEPPTIVQAGWKPNRPDELHALKGDSVVIVKRFKDGWCYAVNPKTGARGMIPQLCFDPPKTAAGSSSPVATLSPAPAARSMSPGADSEVSGISERVTTWFGDVKHLINTEKDKDSRTTS